MKLAAVLVTSTLSCSQDNWACIPGENAFCLKSKTEECQDGTVCDEAYHKLHPTETPCLSKLGGVAMNFPGFNTGQDNWPAAKVTNMRLWDAGVAWCQIHLVSAATDACAGHVI